LSDKPRVLLVDDNPVNLKVAKMLLEEEERRQGLQAGADAFLLKKSFNQESLIQTIGTLIG
jgi:CheY-like chemotaxis protein